MAVWVDGLRCPVLNTRGGLGKGAGNSTNEDDLDHNDKVSRHGAEAEDEEVDQRKLASDNEAVNEPCEFGVHPAR